MESWEGQQYGEYDELERRGEKRRLEFMPTEFIAILGSDKFIQSLVMAAQKFKKDGSETYFDCEISAKKDKFEMSDVMFLDNDSNPRAIKEGTTEKYGDYCYTVFFNSTPKGVIDPGMAVFGGGEDPEGFCGTNDDNINMLIVRARSPDTKLDNTLKGFGDYEKKIDKLANDNKLDQSAVIRTLKEFEIDSFLISYKKGENGKYYLATIDVDEISKSIKIIFRGS